MQCLKFHNDIIFEAEYYERQCQMLYGRPQVARQYAVCFELRLSKYVNVK